MTDKVDKLEHIFALQAAFDEQLARQRHLEAVEPEVWVQRDVLAIVAELGSCWPRSTSSGGKTPSR